MATQRRVEFQGTFDVQEILNAINTLQNRLSKIQLDDSSVRRFERTFSDLKKRAQEIDAEIKQGFTSTSQINNFNNHLQKLGQQMEILRGEIGRIDTSFSNLKLSPQLQKQFENLKNIANSMFDDYANQISSIENKITSFSGKIGVSLAPEEISGLAQAISSEEQLSKLRDEKNASLVQEKTNIEANIKSLKEQLNISKQEVQTALENRDAITAQLAAQRDKIATMRSQGADASALEQERNIRDQLEISNRQANKELRDQEQNQNNIVKSLKKEQTALSEVNSSLVNITKFFQALSGDSSGLDDDAAAAAKEFADLNIKVSQLEKQLEEANAELQKFKDLQSKKVTTGLESSIDDINNFKKGVDKASESTGEMADNMERLNKQDEFFNNLKARATAMFGLTNAFIYMNRFIRESVQTIKELDAAFTEIAVVTNMTTKQLWESFDTYNEMAQRLGTTTVDAIETSALYYQQGLDTVEVLELTEETMKMARIAGMDYAEATDRMTAALRGFKLEMNEASRVNDVFSALAAESAVDTDELSSALTRTASIAASAGMELETTSAFLSQMIETTREAPENLGTAMKTIIARFQELKTAVNDSVEIDGELVEVNKVDTALQSVGVQLRDSLTGQFRDLDDVFLELASKWDTLDRNTQRYVATIAAGSRQQSRFIAMMDNYERTLELVDIAQNSNGASADQFAKTLDSVQTKLNNLQSSFEEFVGTLVKSDFVKGFLDAINNVLQFINDIAENGEVAFAAFVAVAIISIKKIMNNLINGAKTASGLIGAVRDRFLGDSLEKIKKNNDQSIKDLENRLRGSQISNILSQQVSTGIQNGANQVTGVSGTTRSHTKNPVIVSSNQKFNANYLKKIRDRLKTEGSISNEDRTFLKENGVNLGKNNTALLQNVEETIKTRTATGKLTNAINTLGPAISSVGSAISSVITAGVFIDAAQKGTVALGGATAGNITGSLIGALGYAIPGVGTVLGPLFSSLGGSLGALIGEGIATGLDNANYGIGSQESIKRLQEEAQKVAEETSQSIEENQNFIELGEEYLSLSEKVNLTNEEKERLAELNEQLINQWDGLAYVNDSENGLRAININQLKEEIKLKKQLIAQDTAIASFTRYQAELGEVDREGKSTLPDAVGRVTSEQNLLQQYMADYQAGFPNLHELAFPETEINEAGEEINKTQELFKATLKNYIDNDEEIDELIEEALSQSQEHRNKITELYSKMDSDIDTILDAAFTGVSEESFAYLNKTHLNELLKIENLGFSKEELDALATGGLDYSNLLKKREDLTQDFINNLNSFNEQEKEVFSNALGIIGLLGDNQKESKDQIVAYIESELGEDASQAVIDAFESIFEAEYDTLSSNWDKLLDTNKEYVQKLVESFAPEQGGAEIAAKFAQMTISAGDMGSVFITSFQKQFDSILDNFFDIDQITGQRVMKEGVEDKFQAVLDALASTNVTSANSIAQLGVKLKELEYEEDEVLQITSSLGSVFQRTGLTAEEALTDIEAQLEKVNSLIDILGANLDGSLSLSQLDQLNAQLEEMGQNIIDNSRIVATGEGFKITGNIEGIVNSGTAGTREYFLQMANEANAAKFVKEQAAARAEANGEEERANQLKQESLQYAKTSQYYLAAEAQIRANTIKQSIEAENAEKQRLYDLIQQYKDMIAEMERYYNIQRKILQLQNEQTNFELDLELASGSEQASEAMKGQILNLVEQQALLKQAGQIYQRDLKQLGNYINQDFGQFLTVDESGNIFQNTDELIKLAESMKGASEEESEELQKQWDTIQEVQSAYEDLYDTVNSNVQEYKQNLIDQRKLELQIKQYQVDLEKTLRDMIIADMKAEVEATQEKYNKIKQEDQKYLNSLQKNINKRKQMQQDQDRDEEITTLQNRIALLSRDTSGIYSKEIEDLQEELDGLLREKENTTIDRMYEEEQEKTQLVADELDRRYTYLQEQLDRELETYEISNQKVAELLQMKDEEILEWMMQHSEEFRRATTTEQGIFIDTWKTQINEGKGAQDTLTENLDDNKQQILTKFQEIKTGGIDVYIEAMKEADDAKIVMDVDSSQLNVALEKLKELDSKQNDLVKNEAKRQMDSLLAHIENAYSAGNTAEGERLKKEYATYYDLFKSYGGSDRDLEGTKYESYEYVNGKATGDLLGYGGAADVAERLGSNAYSSSKRTKENEEAKNTIGDWTAKSSDGYINIYSNSNGKLFESAVKTENAFADGDISGLTVHRVKNGFAEVTTIGTDTLDLPYHTDKKGTKRWVSLAQLKAYYNGPYEKGGLVNFTGPAWVDGTKSRPEAFLSAADTDNIAKLRDILTKVFDSNGASSNSDSSIQNTGDTYYEFHIKVDELGEGYDAEQMMKDMEKYIVQKANYRKVTNISRR